MCVSVANRTVDQTNIVEEAVVGGANEVSQATVEGVENVAASSGLISQVGRTRPFHTLTCALMCKHHLLLLLLLFVVFSWQEEPVYGVGGGHGSCVVLCLCSSHTQTLFF